MNKNLVEGAHATATRDGWRIRAGAVCLVAAALAEIGGLLLRGPLTSPMGAPARFIEVSSSPTLHLSWELLLPAAMLQCFGWLAVYAWVRPSAEERRAFLGMILAVTSIIVFLPVSGAFGLISHEAALAETAGQRGAVALVAATAEGAVARQFLLVSVLTGLAATGVWSRVFWRVGAWGRWVVPLLILHTITQSITAPMLPPWGYILERVGAVGFLVATLLISARLWNPQL